MTDAAKTENAAADGLIGPDEFHPVAKTEDSSANGLNGPGNFHPLSAMHFFQCHMMPHDQKMAIAKMPDCGLATVYLGGTLLYVGEHIYPGMTALQHAALHGHANRDVLLTMLETIRVNCLST